MISYLGYDQIDSQNEVYGIVASSVLQKIGSKNITPLVEALHNDNEHIRARSALILGMIGPASDEIIALVIPALIKSLEWHAALGKEGSHVNTSVTFGLRRMGKHAIPAVPALIEHLNKSQGSIQGNIASALCSIGPEAKQALPHLIKAFHKPNASKSSDRFVKENVSRAIATMGPSDEITVPMLDEALRRWSGSGDSFLIHRNALEGLKAIGTPEALKVVEEYKKSILYKHFQRENKDR